MAYARGDTLMKLGIISPRILIRRALSSFLASTGTGFVVVEGNSLLENLEEVKNSHADAIILDMGGPWGGDGLSALAKLGLDVRVLVLVDSLDNEFCARALQLGAWGCLSTRQGPLVFQNALNAVSNGKRWTSQQAAQEATNDCLEKKGRSQKGSEGLTPREWEVLGLMANGCRNKEISSRLSICEETAKSHIKSIYRKLKINGRRDAIFRYFEHVHRPADRGPSDLKGQTNRPASTGPRKD